MKKWFSYFALGSLIVMFFVVSCKKDQQVPVNWGYNYFPNNVGHYVIYNVDSLVLNVLHTQPIDTFKYQIKEVIDSIFPDITGRPTQRIERYKRTDPSQPWVIEKVWTGNLTQTDAERNEDNEKYVRLIFPPSLYATWNGNAYNTLGQMNYEYLAVDQPLAVAGTYFDSTLTVLQDSNLNLIQHQFYFEQYARNVGRIYKVIIDLNYSNPNPDISVFNWLNTHNIVITDSLFGKLAGGSVVYTETYVSSGN
jgi:hypothetical protein